MSVCVFCQASTCIGHVLRLYDACEDRQGFTVVTTTDPVYRFAEAVLPKEVRLVRLRPCRLGLRELPATLLGIRRDYNRLFRDRRARTVYFYSYYFDITTFYHVHRIRRRQPVYLIDLFAWARRRTSDGSLRALVLRLVASAVTGAALRYTTDGANRVITYPYRRYGIEKRSPPVAPVIPARFRWKPRDPPEGKRIALLLDSNEGGDPLVYDYPSVLSRVISMLREAGYYVVAKPHPRLGCSSVIRELEVPLVAQEVPSELLEYGSFAAVVGTASAALACPANEARCPVVSLLGVLSMDEDARRKRTSYVLGLAPRIELPRDLDGVGRLLR